MPVDLTCRELVGLVTDFLEGVLPPRRRARVHVHLACCVSCRRYLDQMRLTIGMLRALGPRGRA